MKNVALFITILFITLISSDSVKLNRYNSSTIRDNEKNTIIYLQPFTGFKYTRTLLIKDEIKKFYNVNVEILPELAIYTGARLSVTQRYNANLILQYLINKSLKTNDKILGLTSRDIFTRKIVNGAEMPHWGVFGLGTMPGQTCIVSDFRLNRFKNNDELVVKTVLHEIGHTFGIPHCKKDSRCLMTAAKGTVKTLFNENKWFCPSCLKMLHESSTYIANQ